MNNDKLSKISIKTEKILYFLLASGGMIALSIAAPQLPANLLKAYLKNRKFQKSRFTRDLSRLSERGDVSISANSIKITKKGVSRILKYQIEDIAIDKPSAWDKKWWLVIFDIPDHSKKKSNFLRNKLYDLGFLQYQKSIFIYPYPCQDQIDFIKEVYEVSGYVKLIVAIRIDDEEYFKRKFNLY